MKTVLIQANIGNIDKVAAVEEQSVPVEYKLFTETPYPFSELNNRMKAKYIKLQHHKFLDHYDQFVYIDGRISVTRDFIKEITAPLRNNDIVVSKHLERKTIKEEYEFIFKLMDEGNKYLLSRYDRKTLEKEAKLISSDIPLYACGVFAVKNTSTMNNFFNSWWDKCLKWTSFDQCWFSFLANMSKIKVYGFEHKTFKVGKHR